MIIKYSIGLLKFQHLSKISFNSNHWKAVNICQNVIICYDMQQSLNVINFVSPFMHT